MTSSRVEHLRELAVEQHDEAASEFYEEYRRMAQDPYASAFIYGRTKIDRELDALLHDRPSGSRILDIGCGTGEQISLCRARGFPTDGVEPSQRMRELARCDNPESEIREGLITSLSADDCSYDVVLAIEVLRYLHPHDIDQAYREMRRVLRPGGRIFITMVNLFATDAFYFFDRIKRVALRLASKPQPAHCEFVTPMKMRRKLSQAGFSNVRCVGRLMGAARVAYKIHRSLGSGVARRFEAMDDWVCQLPGSTPFAGHLIVTATRG